MVKVSNVKLIVGLGNIGPEYAGTRHNVGFMVADELARRWDASEAWRKADNAWFLERRVPEKIILIKPTTYMNLSGAAVRDFAGFYHLSPEEVLVIQDDMDLPVGTLRVRRKGTSGGHNGLKSIEQALGSQEYPRIKLGVHDEQAVISHVLHRFEGEERTVMDEVVKKAADAVEDWMQGAPVSDLSQRYNTKKKKDRASAVLQEND